mgnify:CR=1 FL=1
MIPESGQWAPFPPTSWSIIQGCQGDDSTEVRTRFEDLIRRYWAPVYRYVRRDWARNDEEAKDLTQGYFLRFLEADFIRQVDARKGRFRSFVSATLKNFLLMEKRASRAKKRRPEGRLLSLDHVDGSAGFDVPDGSPDPDEAFEADWRRAVLEASLAELRRRAAELGKSAYVECFEVYYLGPEGRDAPSYQDLADRHGLTHGQVRNGLHWAKKTFHEVLRKEVADQSLTEQDAGDEYRELFGSGF